MKRTILALLATAAIAFAGASPASATTEHCPSGGTGHIENGAIDNNLVLPAGTIACVKGSTVAVEFVANGVYTLYQYLGLGQDVSYYVIYEGSPSSSPSTEPTPSYSPSPTPSVEPSPSPTASPTPSASADPSASPTASPSVAPTPSTGATMPPTDTDSTASSEDGIDPNLFIVLAGIFVLAVADGYYRSNAELRRRRGK